MDVTATMVQDNFRYDPAVWEKAWLHLADLCESFQDTDKRIVALEYARKHNPSNIYTLHKIARLAFQAKKYKVCADMYQFIARLYKNDGVAWLCLGHATLMSDELHRCFNAYQKALQTLPVLLVQDLWYGIGLVYLKFKNHSSAEHAFLAVTKLNSSEERLSEVAFMLVHVQHVQNKHASSLSFLERIEQSPPKSVPEVLVLVAIAHCRLRLDDVDAAERVLRRAVEIDGDNIQVLLRVAWCRMRRGLYKEALEVLDKCQQIDKKDPAAYYLTARCMLAQKEWHASHESFQQAIHRKSTSAEYWCSIGILFFEIQQVQEAFEALMRSLKLNPKFARSWYNLGCLYEACNQGKESIIAYQKVSDLDPGFAPAHQRLELLRDSGGEPREGATKASPVHPELEDILPFTFAAMSPNFSEWASGADKSTEKYIPGAVGVINTSRAANPSDAASPEDANPMFLAQPNANGGSGVHMPVPIEAEKYLFPDGQRLMRETEPPTLPVEAGPVVPTGAAVINNSGAGGIASNGDALKKDGASPTNRGRKRAGPSASGQQMAALAAPAPPVTDGTDSAMQLG